LAYTAERPGGILRLNRLHRFCVIALALADRPVWAETISLVAARDNTLYQSTSGALSNGAGQHLFVGRTAQANSLSRRRALLKFDVAGEIAAGSVIQSATLTLHMSRTATASVLIDVHRAFADWGEGASDAPLQEGAGAAAAPGDATWLHTFSNTTSWATSGGDFDPTPLASSNVVGIGFYEWTSSAITADVQAWLDNPASNHGWILLGFETLPQTAKRFDSREHANAAWRPTLTVEFSSPAAPVASLGFLAFQGVALGAVGVLIAKNKLSQGQKSFEKKAVGGNKGCGRPFSLARGYRA